MDRVTPGSILMFGLGGDVVGNALPKAVLLGSGNIRKATTAEDALSGKGLENELPVSTGRMSTRRANEALSLPPGKDRSVMLLETEQHHVDKATAGVDKLLRTTEKAAAATNPVLESRLREMLAEETPALVSWATAQSEKASGAKGALIQAGGDPVAEGILDQVTKGFDKTDNHAKWFGHARTMDAVLTAALKNTTNPAAADALSQVQGSLRAGTIDPSLFGGSADIVDDLHRARAVGARNDSHDHSNLERVCECWENLADAHTRHHTAPEQTIDTLRNNASKLRDHIGVLKEIAHAKANGVSGPPVSDVDNMQQSARWVSRSAARSLAGVTPTAKDEPVLTVDTMQRFSAGYKDAEASFSAKRDALLAVERDSTLLLDTLANACGDLPKSHPQLFMQVAGRIQSGLMYMHANMPPGTLSGLLAPYGSSPPTSLLRDFAMKWNTVFYPETVYDDVKSRVVTSQQMRVLEENHPDLYQQFKQDSIEQLGTHFRSIPHSTKAVLDLLFGTDGLAGPMFSSYAAQQISIAEAEKSGQGSGLMNPDTKSGSSAAPETSGVASIKSSVTNRSG